MTFKAGEEVWCRVDPEHSTLGSLGEVAAVVVGPHGVIRDYYTIDIVGAGTGWAAPESYLRPRKPPPAREETGDWELCPWRPESVPVSEEGRHGQ